MMWTSPLTRGVLLCVLVVCAGCGDDSAVDGSTDAADASPETSDVGTSPSYDFIVVGAGAGGGPLAANLARAGRRVLLLEAGGDPSESLTVQVPAFHTLASEMPELKWDYFVRHYEDDDQSRRDPKWVGGEGGVLYPRAAGIGGCTAHNAMITIYPHESDWNELAALTNDPSWSADSMRRYFENVERNRYLDPGEVGHGYDGWLQVERADPLLALTDRKIRHIVEGAAFAAGDGLIADIGELIGILRRDVNTAAVGRDQLEGIFQIPLATRSGRRNGTRDYVVETRDSGQPLTVRTHALVTRVLFDEADPTRAIGVEYLDGESLYDADPRTPGTASAPQTVTAGEVILSAGSFNTPQLLMLSGIGPAAELERHGIDVRIDLPGVGSNLQDRYEVTVVSEMDSDFSLIENCSFDDDESNECLIDWRNGEGAYTSNGGIAAVVRRSSVAELNPDLIIFGLPGEFRGYEPGYAADGLATRNRFSWAILKAHTGNTAGEVRLRSPNPQERPSINFRYFHEGSTEMEADQNDLEAVVDGVRFVREIIDRTNTVMLIGDMNEIHPGTDVDSQEELEDFVRNESWGHHACCTAAIGADDDPMAVLDTNFRVRGATGLRVVDASVFPTIPGFFIVTPVYMVSEKAAVAILEGR